MKHVIDASQDLFSNLAHEASVSRGLDPADIAILCINPESEYSDLIEKIPEEAIIASGYACYVTDKTTMHPILEACPGAIDSMNKEMPPGSILLIALDDEGVYLGNISTAPHLH